MSTDSLLLLQRIAALTDVDLVFTPAHELTGLMRAGMLSARELVGAVVTRADRLQSSLNPFAATFFDDALTAADAADAALARGEPLGPLHGIPMTIKDGIAAAGRPRTFGSISRAGEIAAVDDIVWQRLRAAGAILIGTTTVPEYFHKVVTDSALFGVTRNPWSLAHTPGGSSGGAASAVAAGLGPLALGSDGGGSLRCPAACTGTLGLKPTPGRVPHVHYPDTFGTYAALGPITRDVRDLAIMMAVMSGAAQDDAASLGVSDLASDGLRTLPSPLRIGWIADPGLRGADPAMAALALGVLETLSDGRITIAPLDGAFLSNAFETYRVIAAVGHAARSREQGPSARALWSESFQALVAQGLSYSADELDAAQHDRTKLFRAVQAVFNTVDLIATPTLTGPPKLVGAEGSVASEAFAAWAAALYPFNLTGHPAISVPCGFTAAGLPVGVQLVAPWYAETRLLSLAAALECNRPWARQRPSL